MDALPASAPHMGFKKVINRRNEDNSCGNPAGTGHNAFDKRHLTHSVIQPDDTGIPTLLSITDPQERPISVAE